MLHWVDTHGVESMLIWAAFILVAGTVPPLSSDAGFFSRWAYGILKAIALNSRGLSNAIGVKLPELKLEKPPAAATGEGKDLVKSSTQDDGTTTITKGDV